MSTSRKSAQERGVDPGPVKSTATRARGTARTRRLRALASFAPSFAPANSTEPEGAAAHPVLDLQAFADAIAEAGWLIDFDWPAWAHTPEAQMLLQDPACTAKATYDQLGKVLTALIRGERFSEGTLEDAFERGFIVAIIRRAEILVPVGNQIRT